MQSGRHGGDRNENHRKNKGEHTKREDADPKARQLLAGVQKALGMTPNMVATMAVSPAVLDGHLTLNAALSRRTIPARQREQIALAVAEANSCDYCFAAHSYIGSASGLSDEEILKSRQGRSADYKTLALLNLAQEIVESGVGSRRPS